MTKLVDVVIELDKRIARMSESDRENPSAFRKGIIEGYHDIREFIQKARERNGELL